MFRAKYFKSIVCSILILLLFLGVFSMLKTPKVSVFASTNNEEFVSVKNGEFNLRNKQFRFMGTNNYYLHYKDNAMIDSVFDSAEAAGFSVIRMWGFFDGGSDENKNNVAWMQPEAGVYTKPSWAEDNYQDCWERMDYAVSKAREKDIKLIIVFTNYWSDFGGIAQYVEWVNQSRATDKKIQQKDFFTDSECKQLYKNYVSHLLNRTNQYTNTKYIDESAVFAWELMNEPRNPLQDSNILYEWTKEMTAYIKNIDNNHLLALGDEGAFTNRADWAYNGEAKGLYDGSDGIDFEKIIKLDNIDFGTYHLYPEAWGAKGNVMQWGIKYIQDHISVGKDANKPVVLEEFGINVASNQNRSLIYETWSEEVYSSGGAGLMFWMLGGKDTGSQSSGGYYPDYDGFRLLYQKNSNLPEMETLILFAKRFAGENVTLSDKIQMISPYLSSREDDNYNIRYVEVDSEITPIFKIQTKIITSEKIKVVDIYTNKDKIGKMKLNNSTGYYEYDLEMKYYLRGAYIDIEVRANLKSGDILKGEKTRIIRLMKYQFEDNYVADYTSKPTSSGIISSYSTPTYNATLNSINYSTFLGGAYAINGKVDKYSYWCEFKLEVSGLSTYLKESHMLVYDVYFEKNALSLYSGEVDSSIEAYETAKGFRNYAALDPGWNKIGLDANNTKATDLQLVTIDNKEYYRQTVKIAYSPLQNVSSLVLGIVFNYAQYSGNFYINNVILQKRVPVGSPTDGYEERPADINFGLILGVTIPVAVVLAGGIITIIIVKNKRRKNEKKA